MLTHRSRAIRARGFTLIELLTVVTMVAILAALAAPSFQQLIANYRVRGAAESVINGLNLARAEAARRNTPVALTLDANSAGWTVAQVSTPSVAIQSSGNGDSSSLNVTSSTTSREIRFLSTGIVDPTFSPRLEQLTISSPVASTDSRQLNILGGGLIRVCDPNITAAGDPRAC